MFSSILPSIPRFAPSVDSDRGRTIKESLIRLSHSLVVLLILNMQHRKKSHTVRQRCVVVIFLLIHYASSDSYPRTRVNFLGRLAVHRHLLNTKAAATSTSLAAAQRQLFVGVKAVGEGHPQVCRHLVTEVHEERRNERCIEEQAREESSQ